MCHQESIRPALPIPTVGSSTRPERHFSHSLATVKIAFARAVLLRWLPPFPYDGLPDDSTDATATASGAET